MRLFLLLAAATLLAQDLVFEHASVLPMTSNTVLKDYSVHVSAGRIAAVAPTSKFKVPANATRIDATAKFLAPGFAEMHGHIPPPTAPASLIDDVLFLYVASGVTTVRGMLGYPGQLELREKAKRNEIVAPTLYLAGPSFSGATVKTVDQAITRVRDQKREGWDLLKIHPGVPLDAYNTMAKTAKEVGIRFGGHVPADVGILRALEAGQETIDHLDGYIEYLDTKGAPISDAAMIEVAKATKKHKASVVPTMVLWETIIGAPDAATVSAFPELQYMPAATVKQWKEAFEFRQKQSSFSPEKVRRIAADRKRLLSILHKEGVTIHFGTDAPQQFSVPGFSVHREMRFMADAGISKYEVIRSGTVNVGEYFRAQDRFGAIAPGQRADMVMLDANPLDNVANYQKISGVVLRGKWMPASDIDARLKQIAARNRQ
jgi:imidazolonepropionase-like amidohydrolase